jgi:hypothetical protein
MVWVLSVYSKHCQLLRFFTINGSTCSGVLNVRYRIGAQVLSHYCERFPQVTSWSLFIIGCLNMLAVSFLQYSISMGDSKLTRSGHLPPLISQDQASTFLVGECVHPVSLPT